VDWVVNIFLPRRTQINANILKAKVFFALFASFAAKMFFIFLLIKPV